MTDRRRTLIDAIKAIPSKHVAWLALPVSIEGFELFCYHGFGVVLNDAQREAAADVLAWPEGSIHLWRWANRAGKTTLLMLLHLYLVWKKWRYVNTDFEAWAAYRYKVLHAAPQGILMGKAWEVADALIAGASIVQRDPINQRQRPGIFVNSPIYKAGHGTSRDGTPQLYVQCLNGGVVDFLQTYSGAGRMESDAWWFIAWDEFGEHQPVANVPNLIDATFLPRSSDFMASIVLASTEKDHNAGVYMELEDLAERNPRDWNLREFGRAANFSQSKESIDRQVRLSSDHATAQRSVFGGASEGGAGSILPGFVVRRAFDPSLPRRRLIAGLPEPPYGRSWKLFQMFDHAVKGDRNVVATFAVVWPITSREDLIQWPAQLIDLDVLRGSRTLTPDEMLRFAVRAHGRYDGKATWYTDTTGEAGIMVHRALRAQGVPSREYNFTARKSATDRRTMKAYGRTGMMRLFALGLPVDEHGRIVLEPGMKLDTMDFGGIRIPHPDPKLPTSSEYQRLFRQLLSLQADDANQSQDHAMTVLMFSGVIHPYIERGARPKATAFSPFGYRGDQPTYR